MKKHFPLLAICIISIISLNAQNKLMTPGTVTPEILRSLETVNESPADPKKMIKSKALRDFSKAFKTVTNEDWFIIQNGFMARFTTQDILHRVIYNKNGRWVATFRYYNGDQLPAKVRNLVNCIWNDADIKQVTEVNYGGKCAYLVNIESSTSLRTIKVVNNETEVFQEIIKIK